MQNGSVLFWSTAQIQFIETSAIQTQTHSTHSSIENNKYAVLELCAKTRAHTRVLQPVAVASYSIFGMCQTKVVLSQTKKTCIEMKSSTTREHQFHSKLLLHFSPVL